MSTSDNSEEFAVALFRSVQGALGAERILLAAGVEHKLIAVPRHLSSKCGFCVRLAFKDSEPIREILEKENLGLEAIVPLQQGTALSK